MNQEQLDQLDPIRCYIMEIPDDAPIYYGRSILSSEWYIATTEEIARWAGEEGERVVTHPESGDPLVRLDWLSNDGYPPEKAAQFKMWLQSRVREEPN